MGVYRKALGILYTRRDQHDSSNGNVAIGI